MSAARAGRWRPATARASARLLRDVLGGLGPDPLTAIDERLGPADARLDAAEQHALWSWRARGDDPLGVFIRLHLLGARVPARLVRAAYGTQHQRALALGIVRAQPGGQAAGLALTLHARTPIFADDPPASGAPPADIVLGPTRATLVLERALPRHTVARALELGTGSGYLALRLAAHARAVTATDVSARALGLAALNLELAGANVELLRSDAYTGLGRRRFDLVVGNLPFVVTPPEQPRLVFRDSPQAEDGFAAAIISGVGRHLVEGGHALFLAQWVHVQDEPEDQRLAPWFVAAGCDALVLRLDAEPLPTYAARWSAGPARGLSPEARIARLERFVTGLRRARINGVSTGLFVLRRRRAPRHLMSIDDLTASDATPTWTEISARLQAMAP